jgi:AraC family transcriptional activator of pobA
MHVETIPERSRLHDWTIRPHAHADLHQFLLILAGGGMLRAETEARGFEAPALIVMPAGTAHGFAFRPETEGFVVTAADTLVADASRGDSSIAELLQSWFCLDGASDVLETHDLRGAFAALAHEYVWSAPGRVPAAEAHLTRILVGAARLALSNRSGAPATPHPDALLVERFRRLIERDFRKALPVGHYALALRVSESRLSAACRRMSGESASRVLHRRLMVEAQRYLLYSVMSVGDIGFALGFVDPAYFSRFFTKRAGLSPAAFRAEKRGALSGR